MYKKSICILLIILITLCEFQITVTAINSENKKKVLIVYDRTTFFGYADDITVSFSELLGHFKVDVTKKSESEYKFGEINNYDYIFIIGIEGNFTNRDLIKDLTNSDKSVCWIGKGIEKFIEQKSDLGLIYTGEISDVSEVYYTNKRDNSKKSLEPTDMKKFILESKREFNILNTNNKNIKIYSYISDGINYYPYVLNKDKFWYIARIQDEDILFYIVADIIYDVLNEKNFEESKVFVRIEDVHPFRDTKKLRDIADYLYSKNIPFMIALIPYYQNPENNYLTSMSENRDFINTIQYMQKKGGSVILHGVTHAGYGGETTGEGYEFWNGINDKPIEENMEKYVSDKIGIGIKECLMNKIYPLAFEAPHYAIDSRGYKELKKYFSTYVGHLQSNDVKFSTVIYPYKLYNTSLFNKLIPENLGYIESENKFAIDEILSNLEKVSIVRGYTAGFFYHPYIDINHLKKIVTELEKNNVSFYDLKEEENWVKWKNIKITSKNGEITSTPEIQYESSKVKDKPQGYISKVNDILMIIIGIFCSIFLIIFYLSRRRNNKRFLR